MYISLQLLQPCDLREPSSGIFKPWQRPFRSCKIGCTESCCASVTMAKGIIEYPYCRSMFLCGLFQFPCSVM